MALNFPTSPSNGDTHVFLQTTYTYNATNDSWEVANAAASTANAFHLGSFDSDGGALRAGGNAPEEGDIYYNTTDDALKSYDGAAWAAASGGSSVISLISANEALITTGPPDTDNTGSFAWNVSELTWESVEIEYSGGSLIITGNASNGTYISSTGGSLDSADGLGNRYVGSTMILAYQNSTETGVWRYIMSDTTIASSTSSPRPLQWDNTDTETFSPTGNFKLGLIEFGSYTSSGGPAVGDAITLGTNLGYTVRGRGTRTHTVVDGNRLTLSAVAPTSGTYTGDYS